MANAASKPARARTRSRRLEARVTVDQKRLIERAAAVRAVSSYLVYICQAVKNRAGLDRYWQAARYHENIDVLAGYAPFEVLDADHDAISESRRGFINRFAIRGSPQRRSSGNGGGSSASSK